MFNINELLMNFDVFHGFDEILIDQTGSQKKLESYFRYFDPDVSKFHFRCFDV